ncbi:MAG TPA: TatD family hydrolase [Bacteroidota bacterium]|nr:TatD family hydrolase [Bacteroidota bacterium]
MFIDSHSHLFYKDYEKDIDDVLKRAADAGMEYAVVPGTNIETTKQAIALAERENSIYAAAGIHPLDLETWTDSTLAEIEQMLSHPKVVAVGEIGLDYYYDRVPRDVQRMRFREQLALAAAHHLPAIIHTRDSMDDALEIVEETIQRFPDWRRVVQDSGRTVEGLKGVFHCYSGDAKTAIRLIKAGFLVSFPGTVTFKNNAAAEVVREIGYDHLMLETDAPYLTPAPHRGKRNEPSYIPLITARIAELCSASTDDIERTTTYNAKKLFGIGALPEPVITYRLGQSLYINLTNRCNADCEFCDRKGGAVIKGYNLKIRREPEAQEVIAEIGDPTKYRDIVFCGYGEPTIRFDTVKTIASWIKAHGGRVRLNTDGHGSVINKRNIAPELKGLVDVVSISLNSIDPIQYGALMNLDGPKFHAAMIDFAKEAKKYVPEVVMSVVGIPEIDLEASKQFVENEIGVTYRVRPYF